MLAQDVEDFRHADEHRDPPCLDLRDDVRRVVAAHEHDRAGQHGGNEGRHGLSEQVAERKEIQEAKRKERPAPLSILQNLALDRHDVREDVPVGDDDAFRLSGCAGGEDDLGDIVACDDGGAAGTDATSD